LTGTVVRDVAAAAGLENVDAARGERVVCRENVRSTAVAADAQRQHVRVFDQQQRVVDALSAAIFDERALKRERVAVRHESEAANR
jgi:hypothetical protein